jgi:tRNA-dihydrouridine synthase C
MEGLLDFVLRDILTRVGGIDRCVSEFIRVTHTLLPERAFIRVIPELRNSGRTFAGVPVRGQLLGSDPACLADNAARLAGLGPEGVDLNFGCPAKLVNRHGGGAALLEDPALIHRIVWAVRGAVPRHQPVSAKMRLGLHDDSRAEECALAIEAGGATEIVVHARTKADAYRPPAYWSRVNDIRSVVKIPVIANGEIWTVQDAVRCRAESGCSSLMIGRGLVTDPGLARAIGAQGTTNAFTPKAGQPFLAWPALLPLMADFWQIVRQELEHRQQAGRLKQWLNFLRHRYPEAQAAYLELRTLNDPLAIDRWMAQQSPAGGVTAGA